MKEEPNQYQTDLVAQLWQYKGVHFAGEDSLFERSIPEEQRPPVFAANAAHLNVLVRPGATVLEKRRVWGELASAKRHRWFRSMKSSQALTQSVFANLKVYGKLDILRDLVGEDGQSLFLRDTVTSLSASLDHSISHLGEPRPTSLDVFLGGSHRVAVECKLTESEFGACSRPNLKPKDPNYESQHCHGSYTKQHNRTERCSLTAIGVEYWRYVPQIFNWPAGSDLEPCPLHEPYQLVRNVLAACVRPDGTLDQTAGHAVLLYDARNPAFHPNGKAWTAFNAVRGSLKQPSLLQCCTWQRIAEVLRNDRDMVWLADVLHEKYGV